LEGLEYRHEDHAVRACYAALRMQQAIRRFTGELRHSHGLEVQIRVGLNSGAVVVGAIGSDLQMDYTAVGQTTPLDDLPPMVEERGRLSRSNSKVEGK
jgi:class 3 adenylate cyclase